MTPLVTFGWANGIAGGLTEMQWDVFIPMTLLGCQLDLILNTYIGISVREINDRIAASADGGGADEAQSLGNGTTGSNSSASVSPSDEDPLTQILPLLQIALCILMFCCTTLYGRRVLKKLVQEEL